MCEMAELDPRPTAFEKMWSGDVKGEALASLLIKQYEDLDGYVDLLKEITLQQKALVRDTEVLNRISAQYDVMKNILSLLQRDGATSCAMEYYREIERILKKRQEFYILVVDQRQTAINFGLDTLDRIPSSKVKSI